MMTGLHKTPIYPHEESIARVVWAAHILSYLTNTRNHEKLHKAENNAERESDTDELSGCETDDETEKTVILSGPRSSVRRKFLDCIAQVLSPCKGWNGVTAAAIREAEDGVEVDIARNDGFLSDDGCFDSQIVGYCKMLEEFLAGSAEGTNTNETSPTEFELKVIDYTSRRIDHWIEDLRKTQKIGQNCPDSNSQRLLGHEAAIKTWTTITDLILQFNADKGAVSSRPLIVQQAYECLKSTQVRQLFLDTFGTQAGLKLWSRLNFIARPPVDCRLLGAIAAREPQFRNCKISLVPPRSKTTLGAKYVVGIFKAWERLGLGSTPEHVALMLDPFSRRFEKACAGTFSLHAEMQLVLHYDEGCAPPAQPTLNYFGCSKRTCLLCETFLNALPSRITTRGRHGVCYPAWAVPGSNSDTVKIAVEELEKSLVVRIRGLLNDLIHPKQKGHAENVMQSGMVSEFSQLTLEEWQQKEQDLRLFKSKQATRREKMLITEGIIPVTRSRYRPLDYFEPDDCCVMCNRSPGLQCARCRSTYYCSRDCQKSDFPSHKLLCKQFATQPDRPSPEHKRAIFFPVERDKPCLIWIPCRREYDEEDGITWTQIDPYPYLGTDKPTEGIMRIEHNPVRCRNLGSGFAGFAQYKAAYCVSLIHRDAYLKDGSSMNRSVLASVKASCASTAPHEYRGPMIALQQLHHEDFADITLADFRHLMDYLVSYGNRHIRESVPDLQYRAPTTVRGVKICCHGEVKLHGSEPFVSVDVTRANQVSLGRGSISPISVCLGMPICLWKDPDAEFRHNPPGWEEVMTADSNPNVAFLMMETDSSKDEWGWASMYWNSDIGNVWAVRKDGQDLAVDDVAMMCHFARRKLQRMFEYVTVMESGSGLASRQRLLVSRQRVLNFITWDNMVTYWDETGGH
ncbi:hypothetical protein BJX61DRAFT_182665 [Aspergillus egyptiacus]|nr:hypothetical protein BJX61DRAFT_182665 [Aspergillus egyptiacus]